MTSVPSRLARRQLLSRFGQPLGGGVGQPEQGALGRESLRKAGAELATGAGDQDSFFV
jgi:hypothetical protein